MAKNEERSLAQVIYDVRGLLDTVKCDGKPYDQELHARTVLAVYDEQVRRLSQRAEAMLQAQQRTSDALVGLARQAGNDLQEAKGQLVDASKVIDGSAAVAAGQRTFDAFTQFRHDYHHSISTLSDQHTSLTERIGTIEMRMEDMLAAQATLDRKMDMVLESRNQTPPWAAKMQAWVSAIGKQASANAKMQDTRFDILYDMLDRIGQAVVPKPKAVKKTKKKPTPKPAKKKPAARPTVKRTKARK